MSSCNRTNCNGAGTHYIKANIWAQGAPKSTVPLTVTFPLQLCRDHAAEEVNEGASSPLLGEEFWTRLERINASLHKAAPDPASAELVALRGNATDAVNAAKSS